MEINGLKLPATFVRDIQEGKFQRVIGCWELKENVDAFGNHLETDIGDVYEDTKSIIRQTNDVGEDFTSYKLYEPNEWDNKPGYIPYISDFSKVVCFGTSGDGADFCFDYRKDINNPSVIWWDDVYWRRIAPDYDSFIDLFDFSKDNNKFVS